MTAPKKNDKINSCKKTRNPYYNHFPLLSSNLYLSCKCLVKRLLSRLAISPLLLIFMLKFGLARLDRFSLVLFLGFFYWICLKYRPNIFFDLFMSNCCWLYRIIDYFFMLYIILCFMRWYSEVFFWASVRMFWNSALRKMVCSRLLCYLNMLLF